MLIAMKTFRFVERAMTETELEQETTGFERHALEQGNPVETPERINVMVLDQERFVGRASGLAYKSELGYSRYFHLTDLFIEKAYRGNGLGREVLQRLEAKLSPLGIEVIWTWTTHDALGFYRKQGYTIFCELEHWFHNGQSHYGLRKNLTKSVVSSQ
jgi:GNAT superfamily N-acetyltransferase